MHFGRKLLASRYEPWAVYYLDYGQLKTLLEEEEDPTDTTQALTAEGGRHVRNPSNGSSILHGSLHEGSSLFLLLLHREVEKIFLFFLAEEGQIATELASLQHEIRRHGQDPSVWSESGGAAAKSDQLVAKKMTDLATHLLRLVQYVDLNLTAIRKILKKHDKVAHIKLTAKYLGRKAPLLQPLLTNESLDGLIRVYTTVLESWKDVNEEQRMLFTQQVEFLPVTDPRRSFRSNMRSNSFLDSLRGPAVPALAVSAHSPTDAARPFFTNGDLVAVRAEEKLVEHMLHQIRDARKKLQTTNEFVQLLAAPMMVVEEEEGDSVEDVTESERGDLPSAFSNFLNLFSTFLYMSNYYIVAPASNTYAEKLGSDASMAGVIIGMTPVAALVSTLLYSWWTSYSYKSALIFASTCSLIGNILYAIGLPCQSLTLVMLGRLLNGFGSARSINRRYIADTFARTERTAASAAFVTAGALGMAAGPAVASLLNYTVSSQNNLYWQVENAPGWVMMFAWAIYLVCLVLYFTDPPKRHAPAPLPPTMKLTGEKKPLLINGSSSYLTEVEPPIWQNAPVLITFLVYFVLKTSLESSLSSAALVTSNLFAWSGQVTGAYLAALGLLMLPANLVVAYLSRAYEDRQLIRALQGTMLLGCLAVLPFAPHYSVTQYIGASVLIFISANALEGPNMSLLSKTIPRSWSKGFFNVGLLATEAGTLGRAVGDVLLTVWGGQGMHHLLQATFGIMSALCFLALLLTMRFYHRLEPRDKDD